MLLLNPDGPMCCWLDRYIDKQRDIYYIENIQWIRSRKQYNIFPYHNIIPINL